MKKKTSIILVIIWMIIIFIMSSFNADTSSSQSNIIVNFISNIFNINNINLLSFIIRKLAHFTEYFILGILLYNCFIISFNMNLYIPIIICIMYAISDEIHQLFVSGRVFQVRDIIIDTCGGIIGIILFHIYKQKFDKKK